MAVGEARPMVDRGGEYLLSADMLAGREPITKKIADKVAEQLRERDETAP